MRPKSQMCTSEGVSDRQRVCRVRSISRAYRESIHDLGRPDLQNRGTIALFCLCAPCHPKSRPRKAEAATCSRAARRGWRSHSAHTAAKWLTIAHWPYFMVIRADRQWNIQHRPEYRSLVKRTGIRRACRQPSSIFYGGTGSAGDNLVKRRKDESCTAGTPGPAS